MRLWLSLLMSLTFLNSVSAQQTSDKPPIEFKMEVFKVIVDSVGNEVFVPADSVYPGDILEYRLIYKNLSDAPILNLRPQTPIPSNTEYIDGTAFASKPSVIKFSIDNGKSFHIPPIYYTVTTPDGKTIREKATPDMFTDIKWEAKEPVKPNETVIFSYRVKVK